MTRHQMTLWDEGKKVALELEKLKNALLRNLKNHKKKSTKKPFKSIWKY